MWNGKGGVVVPGDVDENAGELVCDTLKLKHPEGRDRVVVKPATVWYLSRIDSNWSKHRTRRIGCEKLPSSAGFSGTDSIAMTH